MQVSFGEFVLEKNLPNLISEIREAPPTITGIGQRLNATTRERSRSARTTPPP
jgi:hypothetical protein